MRWLRGLWRRWQGRCPRCGSIVVDRVPVGFADWQDRCSDCDWSRDV